MPQYFIFYLIVTNILTFIAFGIDKAKAKHKKYRTPEALLLFLATIGGSAGALLGMLLFHHKTLHTKFAVGVPLLLLVHIAIGVLLYTRFFGEAGM